MTEGVNMSIYPGGQKRVFFYKQLQKICFYSLIAYYFKPINKTLPVFIFLDLEECTFFPIFLADELD